MTWRWVTEGRTQPVADLDRSFPSQGEAESWLGEFYPDLLDQGVRAVSLFEADRQVYGPMNLDVDG